MSQKRFGRLRFKPHESKDVTEIKELFKYREFDRVKNWKDLKKALCYLVFLYDPYSELVEDQRTLSERKDAAATEAGFLRHASGEWPDAVQKYMSLENEEFRDAVLRFLKIINNREYREIVTLEEELEQCNRLRMEPLGELKGKDATDLLTRRDKLMDMSEKRISALDALYRKFYQDNVDLKEATQAQLVPITPENAIYILKDVSQN